MLLHGKITVTSQAPVGLLAAFFHARGFNSCDELGELVGCSRQAISRASQGKGCGKLLAHKIEKATGLPASRLAFGERQLVWSFKIDEEGRASVL